MAFPSTPANGTVYTASNGLDYIYISDNSSWRKQTISVADENYVRVDSISGANSTQADQAQQNIDFTFPFGPHKVTLHTTSATHTYDANTCFAMVYVQGGGGGGGGSNSNVSSASNYGRGGSAGVCAVKLIDVANQSIATSTITVGAGGSGGAGTGDGGQPGSVGSNSVYSDGTYAVTGEGGANGQGGVSFANLGVGLNKNPPTEIGWGGDYYLWGNRHDCAIAHGDDAAGSATLEGNGGKGARSFFGHPGKGGRARGSSAASDPGDAGVGYGAGGSGAGSCHGGGNASGAAGTDGCVLILEWQ